MKKSLKLTTLSSAVVLALGLTTSFASLASSDDDDYKKQTACFDTSYAGMVMSAVRNGDFVEVEGYVDDKGYFIVSELEHKKTSKKKVELKGFATDLMGDTFSVNGVSIDASNAKFKDFSKGLYEGDYVEVKGYFDGSQMMAKKVESEEFEYGDKKEFELKGYVSDYVDNGSFKVNGIPVNASNAKMEAPKFKAPENAYVKVEGHFVNGVLVIEKMDVQRNDVEISAPITSINMMEYSFEVTPYDGQAPIVIYTDSNTKFESESYDDYAFKMENLRVGDFVEVDGYRNDDGAIFAKEVEMTYDYEVEVQGMVEHFYNNKITVLGVDFFVDGYTRFEDDQDNYLSQSQFESMINVGQTWIEVEDENRDGIADKIEIKYY